MFGLRIETPWGEIKNDPAKIEIPKLNDVINGAINVISGGLVGLNKDGNLGAGIQTRALTEGIGELTGANQQRRANNMAEQALAEQRAEAERLRKEQIEGMRRNELSASRKAGMAQTNSYLTASAGTQAYNNLTRDFLGL